MGEKLYYTIISIVIVFIFALWLGFNVFGVNSLIFSLLILIFLTSLFYYFNYHKLQKIQNHKKFNVKKIHTKVIPKTHLILNMLLIITIALWSLPLLNPILPVGNGFTAPVHDGLSVFIARNNAMPDAVGIFLYPNAMHVFSSFFLKLGLTEMHANLPAILAMIIVSTYSLFLLLNYLYKDQIKNAIIAGLFGLSSYMLPYLYHISRPQLFSSFFIFPAILFFLKSYESKKYIGLFAITMAMVAASHMLIFPFLFIILLFVSLFKNKKISTLLFVSTIILSSLVFITASDIYYDNLSKDMLDCNDSTNYMIPLLPLGFMLFFVIGFYYFIKRKKFKTNFGLVLLIFIILSLIPMFYESIYPHNITDYESCIEASKQGFFSGYTRFRFLRLAFLQAFFLPLVLPAINKKYLFYFGIVFMLFPINMPNVAPIGGSFPLEKTFILSSPLLTYESSQWIEQGYNQEFSALLYKIRPKINKENRLALVITGNQSFHQRYFLWLFFDQNYGYVLNSPKFYEKYADRYIYFLTTCKTEGLKPIIKGKNYCIFTN